MKTFDNKNEFLFGSKAKTLELLLSKGYSVPKLYYFSIKEWNTNKNKILTDIILKFKEEELIAVRSSSLSEDTPDQSNAGAFESILNIKLRKNEIEKAINNVKNSLDKNIDNQILIQKMVIDVAMSGVLMTKNLEDGSPYYVLNYDDSTGRTDSVTKGDSINKTVFIYNGVNKKDFDSQLILNLINVVQKIEKTCNHKPLDIEFAVDKKEEVHILQVRPITTLKNWDVKLNKKVSVRFKYLRSFVDSIMKPKPGLAGKTTLLGIMSDWNPAEMIGVTPRPLAASLYRHLITNDTWSIARSEMGYQSVPPKTDLMVSLFGRVYIDLRNSFNSFLPNKLPNSLSEKLIDCYIERLRNNPHLHDKIEFDVAFTCYEFGIKRKLEKRFPNIFTNKEKDKLIEGLHSITSEAIQNKNSSLYSASRQIDKLEKLQENFIRNDYSEPFFYASNVIDLIEECKSLGTKPFSIIARHAFISEVFLRGIIESGALSKERVNLFRKSIETIATKMSNDFYDVYSKKLSKHNFLKKYGHLRPSSYDILSKSYNERPEIFEGDSFKKTKPFKFKLTITEKTKLDTFLKDNNFKSSSSESLLKYIKDSIVGREYSKFIFTRHINEILFNIELWGKKIGLNKEDLSMLSIDKVTETVFSPLKTEHKKHYKNIVKDEIINLSIANSFKLNYLIRNSRDIHIVPVQRNQPNFIGSKVIKGDLVKLSPYIKPKDLEGKIVLIESADPGYDWLFSRNIKALVTKYGGINSHMSIRCAELGINAIIGCGEQNFDRLSRLSNCIINGKEQIVYQFGTHKKIF